jgi:translation initiation factor 4E
MSTPNTLPNPITLWYRSSYDDTNYQKNINQEEYTESIKQVYEMKTIDDFYNIYSFLKKPDNSSSGIEVALFKNKIRPVWEETSNKEGGKLSLKLKKDQSNCIWDELVVRFVGNSFPLIDNNEINGVLFSVKNYFISVQIWFKSYNNSISDALNQSLKEVFGLEESYEFEIRGFNSKNSDYSHNHNHNHKAYYVGSYNNNNNKKNYNK